jgi:predicted dehydrogenase
MYVVAKASPAALRMGLIGASVIAPWAIVEPAKHRKHVQLQAVAARDPARAARFAAEYGVAHVAASYADLVTRDDIDVVYIALPASENQRWVVAALQAGKAVLCEKPLAVTTRQIALMFDAAEAAQRPLWEAMHYRHHPAMQLFLDTVRGGAIGTLQRVEARFVGHLPNKPGEIRWQAALGGGATMDLGCYALHALRTLLGDPLRVVSARAQFDAGIDAALSADLVSAGGIPARMACSFLEAEHRSQLLAFGSHGSLRFDNFTSPTWRGQLLLEQNGSRRSLPITPSSTYAMQLDFVSRHWLAPPEKQHRVDSLANMALIEDVLRAAGLSSPDTAS